MVNNYGVYMQAGYACADSPHAALGYFFFFYFMLVFLLINLLISFILESVLTAFERADVELPSPQAHSAGPAVDTAAESANNISSGAGSVIGDTRSSPEVLAALSQPLAPLRTQHHTTPVGLLLSPTQLRAEADWGGGTSSSNSTVDGRPAAPQGGLTALEEAALDEAEKFAEQCAERLRAEGNTSVVSVRHQPQDGYTALVRLVASTGNARGPSTRSGMSAPTAPPLVASGTDSHRLGRV